MKQRLRFFEDAAAEIEHERAWYRSKSHVAEAAFLRELEHAVEAVTEGPETWPRYLVGTRRYVFAKFHSLCVRAGRAAERGAVGPAAGLRPLLAAG